MVFFACFFQIIRTICEVLALNRISRQVALRYCRDPWRILDFVAVVSALWAAIRYGIQLDSGFYEEENYDPEEGVPAIVYTLILGLL